MTERKVVTGNTVEKGLSGIPVQQPQQGSQSSGSQQQSGSGSSGSQSSGQSGGSQNQGK